MGITLNGVGLVFVFRRETDPYKYSSCSEEQGENETRVVFHTEALLAVEMGHRDWLKCGKHGWFRRHLCV